MHAGGAPRSLYGDSSTAESEIQGMAGNLPVPQGVEVKLLWHLNGVPAAINVVHFANPQNTPVNQANTNAWDTAIKAAFTNSGQAPNTFTGVTLHHIEARSMASNSDPWFVSDGAPTPGTGAGNPLPAATSYVVSLRTGLRGRSFNGRFYVWGFTEDANDAAGGITTVASTGARNFVASIGTVLSGAPYLMVWSLLSRWTTPPGTGIAIERNPPVLTPITSAVARDLRWDVQRRRAIPGI